MGKMGAWELTDSDGNIIGNYRFQTNAMKAARAKGLKDSKIKFVVLPEGSGTEDRPKKQR